MLILQVLIFETSMAKDEFYNALKAFVTRNGVGVNVPKNIPTAQIKMEARTKASRQQLLEQFFRAVFKSVSLSFNPRMYPSEHNNLAL